MACAIVTINILIFKQYKKYKIWCSMYLISNCVVEQPYDRTVLAIQYRNPDRIIIKMPKVTTIEIPVFWSCCDFLKYHS